MRRAIFVSAALALAGGASEFTARRAGAAPAPCCYTNPQYSGVCTVQPAEGETCAAILAYLNDPQSQGKSYCGNTSIRGGWKQQACASSTRPRTSAGSSLGGRGDCARPLDQLAAAGPTVRD